MRAREKSSLASQEQILIHQCYSTTTATPGFSILANVPIGKADASMTCIASKGRKVELHLPSLSILRS